MCPSRFDVVVKLGEVVWVLGVEVKGWSKGVRRKALRVRLCGQRDGHGIKAAEGQKVLL